MTNVLVTGGAGFIASHLIDQLLARGDTVLVIDNFATSRRDTLTPHDGLRVVEGSIADPEVIATSFDEFRPAVVVHAAASYKDPENWDEDARTNAVGTALVVRAAERLEVGRFVYFQTALCYGLHPSEQPITLTHPLDPNASSYAISKTAGEWYVRFEQPRLDLLPPRKRLRPEESERAASDLLRAADRRQARVRDGHTARLHLRRRSGGGGDEGDRRPR